MRLSVSVQVIPLGTAREQSVEFAGTYAVFLWVRLRRFGRPNGERAAERGLGVHADDGFRGVTSKVVMLRLHRGE